MDFLLLVVTNITFSPSSNTNNIAIAIESKSNSVSSVIMAASAAETAINTNMSSAVVGMVVSTNRKKKKKEKRFVLIHIGPSKTGTTTIQKDSSTDSGYIQALKQDNTLYVGKFHSRKDEQIKEWRSSVKCMEENIFGQSRNYTYELDEHDKKTDKIIPIIADNDNNKKQIIDKCWKQGNNHDNTMMMNGTTTLKEMNIIDSDEGYSYKLGRLRERIQIYQMIFVDYLHYDELIIVGAYRRYYEWLPSTYKEQTKNFCFGFDIQRHTEYPHSPLKACQSMWDYIWKRHTKRSHEYNTGYYQNIHRTLPLARRIVLSTNTPTSTTINNDDIEDIANATTNKVEILNYFQLPNEEYYSSITTELYCSVLGMDRTPHTCHYSRQKGVTADIHHKGSVDNVPYKLILKEAHQRGWVSGYPTTSKNYQAMLYANSTIQTWKELQDYHIQLLLPTTTTTTTTTTYNSSSGERERDDESTTTTATPTKENGRMIFPLLCPTKSQLQTFLTKSLLFEKLVMPQFYQTELGEQAHTKAFWKVTANGTTSTENMFCGIDIQTFFGNVTSWEQLLEERMSIETW